LESTSLSLSLSLSLLLEDDGVSESNNKASTLCALYLGFLP
jgi:hypothetical protein